MDISVPVTTLSHVYPVYSRGVMSTSDDVENAGSTPVESEKLQQPEGMLNLIPAALLMVDALGRIGAANPVAAQLFGVEIDALVGSHLGAFSAEDREDRGEANLLDELLTPDGYVWGSWLLARGEESVKVQLKGVRDSSSGGSLLMIEERTPEQKLAHEKHARREAETELTDTRQRLATIVETTADAIISFDELGLIDFANPAAGAMFGFRVEDLVGESVDRIVSISPDPQVLIAGESYSVTGSRSNGEQFPAQVTLSRMTLHDQRLFTAVIRDQTDVASMERKFIEAQRLEAAGALASRTTSTTS